MKCYICKKEITTDRYEAKFVKTAEAHTACVLKILEEEYPAFVKILDNK